MVSPLDGIANRRQAAEARSGRRRLFFGSFAESVEESHFEYRLAVIATFLGLDIIMLGIVFQIPVLMHESYWQIPAAFSVAGFIRYGRFSGWRQAIGEAGRSTMAIAAANSIMMTCVSLTLYGL